MLIAVIYLVLGDSNYDKSLVVLPGRKIDVSISDIARL